MAEKKQSRMADSEIMSRVNQKVKECVGWYDSRLSKERQRVINYYNGTLPARQHLGSSPYVSTDVYDSVESMKSQLVETYSANPDNLVSFPPLGDQDVQSSKEATEYCNHVFFVENDGNRLLLNSAHDGLTARSGVVKMYWDKRTKDIEEEIPAGASYEDVQALAAQPDITDLHAEADEATGMFSGKLTRSYECSQVQIDNMAPEEFLIAPRSPDIETADLTSHRTLKSKAELKRMGYKSSVVDDLHYDDDKGLDLSPEVIARHAQIETAQALNDPIQPELEKVMLYETYVRMDLKDGKGVKLYKMVHAGDTLLDDPQEVDRCPFYDFTPLPVPHIFYGNNFAARVIPYQNARTVLTRSILDHAAITTNPKWGVVKGGLLNPREMIENRLGGILNLTRPDAVQALEQHNLNPFVFQTLETLKANKEESTGISSLSQGLNKDAISTQNSSALVDNLVTLSQTRQKVIARQFGKFIANIYVGIYKLVLENKTEASKKVIKVAGSFTPVSVDDWIERATCNVALHLGYGEREREVAKYEGLAKSLVGNPMFLPPNQYALITDAMKKAGFENWNNYLSTPDKIQTPQPDPLKVKELEIKDTEAQAALVTAKANAFKNEKHAEVAELKESIAEMALHLKTMIAQRDQDRKDADVKNRIDISQREIEILEKQPVTTETGVVSPKG